MSTNPELGGCLRNPKESANTLRHRVILFDTLTFGTQLDGAHEVPTAPE